MKRKIYEKMLAWKASANGKSALMLDGARRVGKSYIAQEFARNEYESHLLIDFAKASRDVKGYFLDTSTRVRTKSVRSDSRIRPRS